MKEDVVLLCPALLLSVPFLLRGLYLCRARKLVSQIAVLSPYCSAAMIELEQQTESSRDQSHAPCEEKCQHWISSSGAMPLVKRSASTEFQHL
jgi:hypothetical protein